MRKRSVVWVAFNVFFFIFAVTRFAHCEKVELTASPRVSMAPSAITLRLVITDATEELWCPKVSWVWPDGTKSEEESDCDSFEDADPQAIARQSWTRRIRVGAGEYEFVAELSKSGKVIRRLTVKVTVAGG